MRRRKFGMIVVLMCAVLFASCGESRAGLVTGRYYQPGQEDAAEGIAVSAETGDAVEQEDTAQTEDGSAEGLLAAAEGSSQQEVSQDTSDAIGTDLFMIMNNDMQGESLLLQQLASHKQYIYSYTLATGFYDKYGNRAAVSGFTPGRVVTIGERDSQGRVLKVQLSDQVWEYPDVKNYSIDEEKGIFATGGECYSVDDRTFIHSDGNVEQLSDLTDMDTLKLVGVGKNLLSISVTTGHGQMKLINTSLFEGSFIQIGSSIFTEITGPMSIDLPEGTYTVTVANDGYGGSTDVTIERGQEFTLDLDTLKGEGPKYGNILFAVDVEGAVLMIDGTPVDYSEVIPLRYGVHTITVSADSYETYTKRLFVNSEEATIVIGLTSTGSSSSSSSTSTASSDDETSSSSSSSSTTATAGSLAGSLAGSYSGGSSSGSQSDISSAEVDTIVNELLGDSSSSDSSSSDYISTLSSLLETVTGSSSD